MKKEDRIKRGLSAVIFVYLLCFMFRMLEYFVLRTDETFWGEAFVHKLAGIAILILAVKYYNLEFSEIGFEKERILRNLAAGLVFGLVVFIPAYLIEILIVVMQGRFEALDLYVSAYSVNGMIGNQKGVLFLYLLLLHPVYSDYGILWLL